jgi:hypothetical protein
LRAASNEHRFREAGATTAGLNPELSIAAATTLRVELLHAESFAQTCAKIGSKFLRGFAGGELSRELKNENQVSPSSLPLSMALFLFALLSGVRRQRCRVQTERASQRQPRIFAQLRLF